MRKLGYRIDSHKVGELTFVHIAWNSRLVKKEKVARIQRGPGLHRFERSKWQHNPTCLTLLASLIWIFCIFVFLHCYHRSKWQRCQTCLKLLAVFCIFVFLYICISVFLYVCISVFLYFCTSIFLYFCISVFLYFCFLKPILL